MLLPVKSRAQQSLSTEGQVGLGNVNTAETLGQSNMVLSLLARYTQYGATDPRGEIGEVFFAFAYGLTNHLDLSIVFPYVTIDVGRNDLDKISFAAKYKIIERGKVIVAISPKIRVSVGAAPSLVRTRQTNIFIEANTRIQRGAQRIYINFGYGLIDYMDNLALEMTVTKILSFATGVSHVWGKSVTVFAEASGQKLIRQTDGDLYFQLGGIWRIHKGLIFKGSAGMGLPNKDRANTDQRAILGFSFFI
jgi:hypothetical protein